MAIKKSGKCYNYVKNALRRIGIGGLESLQISTPTRGVDHLIMIGDEVIGEYNQVARRIILYDEWPGGRNSPLLKQTAFRENYVRTMTNIIDE